MNIHKQIKGDGVVVQMGRETIFFFFFAIHHCMQNFPHEGSKSLCLQWKPESSIIHIYHS